jgi:hypothetical protein
VQRQVSPCKIHAVNNGDDEGDLQRFRSHRIAAAKSASATARALAARGTSAY